MPSKQEALLTLTKMGVTRADGGLPGVAETNLSLQRRSCLEDPREAVTPSPLLLRSDFVI